MGVFTFRDGGIEVSLKMEDVAYCPGEEELHFEDVAG
jgi:hypothetical protein